MKPVFIALIIIAALLVGALVIFLIIRSKKRTVTEKPAEEFKNLEPAEALAEEPGVAVKVEEPEQTPVNSILAPEEAAKEDEEDEGDDEYTVLQQITEDGKTRYIVIKYSKSFLAKLIQSDEVTKNYYSQLKNKLLSYKGVKSRISWKWETFRSGRKTLAKMRLRGKTLSLCLALNPDDYTDTKYHVESLAEVKSYVDTPCMYRMKNDRRLRYGGELIEEVMRQNDVEANVTAEICDYAAQNPYETTEALIERKLIKVLTDEDAQSGTKFKPRMSVTAQEVDSLMQDEVAAVLIEKDDDDEYVTDKTKQSIVNIDTLSQCFKNGETVTLEEVKKRVKGFDKRTTYLKVLARGTLDKALTIEADSFSIQAVKMIVLTGGKAVKK